MYQLRRSSRAVLRFKAVLLLVASLASWRATTTLGQEPDFGEPHAFQAHRRYGTSGHAPPRTPADQAQAVQTASFESPAENERSAKAAPAANGSDRASPNERSLGPTPKRPSTETAPRQLGAMPATATSRGATPAGPGPLPISRSNAGGTSRAASGKADLESQNSSRAIGWDSLLTVAGSLGIVVGLFMVTMWCLRRSAPKAARSLPGEVVEVIGRAALSGRQQMHLIRFGGKLVLAAATPEGIDAISEITDPVEVDRLVGYCEQTRPSSASASFRGILDRLDERSMHKFDEPSRRPARGFSSIAGSQNLRAEGEYA